MELVLLRHAQPQWIDDSGQGINDPPLTSVGVEKTLHLAQSLGREDFHSISVSPYLRCQQTAQHLFSKNGAAQFNTCSWLKEIGLPDFSAQPDAQISEFFSKAKQRSLGQWWQGVPGGESFTSFHQRVTSGLSLFLKSLGIARLRPEVEDDFHLFSIDPSTYGSKHLIVSHLGTSGLILSELLHLKLVPWIWESFALDWNGTVRFETTKLADGYVFCLRSFNEGGHRDPSLGCPREKHQ